ncbi:MAG: response regulator [Thiomargarita sp.]|nr:response regulator [Thiomargarita sp.]
MQKESCLLIVDDDEHGREALGMLLSREKYQLAFAANGEEALQIAEEIMPDLILLDLMMPEMDGFEVCKRMRVHPQLAEVPIIMLTAISDRKVRLSGIEAGADDFITKPFDKLELLARVRTITRLNRYRHLLSERLRFEWTVEQSDDGYLLIGLDDTIQYANSGARLYLGLLSESAFSERFLKHAETQKFNCEPATAWENWPKPNVGSMTRYLVRPESDSEPSLWLQVDILDLLGGTGRNQLVHLRDVSEQIHLQRQMWTFQTFVSHKLRAPLNGLIGLQILEQTKIDLSSSQAHSLLKIAQESAKRLQDQILDILRYVDSSQLLQEKNVFSLFKISSLINEIKEDLEIGTVSVYIADSLVNKSLAFSNLAIELVLRELFTNAKKFHPQQSPIIEVSIKHQDLATIILSVSDDGQSVASKELAKVWVPYYQSEKYFTGEVKGMGLGLSKISELVWSSGGTCRLSNREVEPGVTIEITLPLVMEK